jgi:hypothetical protein
LERGPITSAWRTSVQYIRISDTHTTPYIGIKQLVRMLRDLPSSDPPLVRTL